jgi:sec-independent protein translocase protein TatA
MLNYFANGQLLVLSEGHIFLIALIALLLFGGKKIPELMRGLGSGIREFNDAKNNVKREIEEGMKKDVPPANPPQQNTVNTTNSGTPANANQQTNA